MILSKLSSTQVTEQATSPAWMGSRMAEAATRSVATIKTFMEFMVSSAKCGHQSVFLGRRTTEVGPGFVVA